MTKVYFVRHAEPNYNNRDDLSRELSVKGMVDRELVTRFLSDKHIDVVLSSPYKRAVDTVAHFANNNEVQSRNISALNSVLEKYKGKNIAIGSHGTALSTIINYYDKSFGYEDFERIRTVMPWIVEFTFQNDECISIKYVDLFSL